MLTTTKHQSLIQESLKIPKNPSNFNREFYATPGEQLNDIKADNIISEKVTLSVNDRM